MMVLILGDLIEKGTHFHFLLAVDYVQWGRRGLLD